MNRAELITVINTFLLKLAEVRRPVSLIRSGGKYHPGEPTQSDKPSPHSSFQVRNLWGKARVAYTEKKGFTVSSIANTNSMEPLFDDNCVVVLEHLTGKWQYSRLRRQPLVSGDIVIYQLKSGVRIIHTLKSETTFLGRKAWIVQGQNNFLPDMAKIPEAAVRERLVAIFYGRQVRKGD